MTADDVYEIMKYCVAKNTSQGYLSPEDFFRTINSAQQQYLDELLGSYKKYQPTRPIPVVAFGQTQKIRQSLSPLVYGTVLSINSITGIASFPYDFEQVDAMWSQYNFYNIKFVQQDFLSSYYRSTIDPIESNPVYLLKHEGFQFYPENYGFARLSYIRTPPSIVWAWVYDSNNVPVYDPVNSQHPVWADYDMLNIISRALRMVGVNLQFNDVIQYANEIKTIGQ